MPSMLWCSATQKRWKPSPSTCRASARALCSAWAGVPSSRIGARSRAEKRVWAMRDIGNLMRMADLDARVQVRSVGAGVPALAAVRGLGFDQHVALVVEQPALRREAQRAGLEQ